ncbi:MAG: flavin reductase family protein [Clostridiales bacterium]|nr:flavin reductase family protein [Clostridiales bacterium]
MSDKIKWKGGALLAPNPTAMVTCGSLDKPNIITIGWTGILCTNPPKTYISLRRERYSYDIIKESGKFVINLTTAALTRACDFCGVRSGRDIDKVEACQKLVEGGLHIVPALELDDTPMIAESPVSLECRVTSILPFEDGVSSKGEPKPATHDMFIADIVSAAIDPSLVDKNGALHLDRAGLIAYAHGDYFALGKKLGDFGYSVRKKKRGNYKKK